MSAILTRILFAASAYNGVATAKAVRADRKLDHRISGSELHSRLFPLERH